MSNEAILVKVTLEDREDGGLRVSSQDMHGLILSGSDASVVMEMIAPAIAALWQHRYNREASVTPATSYADMLDEVRPCDVDMHVKTFVIAPKVPA